MTPDDPATPSVTEGEAVSQNGQPEEEPLRRVSVGEFELPPVHEIPIPENDDDDIFDEPQWGTDSEPMPTTPSLQSDNEQIPDGAMENPKENYR